LEETEVIQKIKQGQRQYFEILIQNYEKLVFRILHNMLPFDSDCIEDLAQEIFIKVFDRIGDYDENYPFRNWIYTITLNKARNFLRKKKVKHFFQSQQLETVSVNDSDEMEDREMKSRLREEIEKLPVYMREVLFLYYNEEIKIREISRMMGKNENTIKTWLKRAKEKLEKNSEIKKFL
jgi:RNA polymerase sigma-70 factor (ECF subfamily)